MKVSLPAMQGTIGKKTYYSTLMKLKSVPNMFRFTDWADSLPEDREQRVLNKKRIPDITRYILDNEDSYLFSSITASYNCTVVFTPVAQGEQFGTLELDLDDADFVINDGQHRCAAIAAAVKENPEIGNETISVLLFEYENRDRVQQMFSDLNRYVSKTSKSLDILYDKRDDLATVSLAIVENVSAFKGLIDKDSVSLPVRSPKLFSLAALYDATSELLKHRIDVKEEEKLSVDQLIALGSEYWMAVSKVMPDWRKVRDGELRALELRQTSISSHAVVLRALGGIGSELMHAPDTLSLRLGLLASIDWSKKNRKWEGVCIIANSVVSNRQARFATKAFLKRELGMTLNDAELRALTPASNSVSIAEEN
jgi:DNA sulfur modification protein DndB